MANLYNKRSASPERRADAVELFTIVRDFLGTCKDPAVLEYGDELIRLLADRYAIEVRSGRLWIEAWNDTRSLARRILSVETYKPGCLDCTVQRFGAATGELSFLDLARPQTATKRMRGERQTFAEKFRLNLSRQFPGWEVPALSCGMDLERSLSSVFPRARLRRGNVQLAALACETAEDESAMLTSALIWHDHVSKLGKRGTQTGLCLFVPDTAGTLTAHRLKWLTGRGLQARIFRFNQDGAAGEVDPNDLGNIRTSVRQHRAPLPLGLRLRDLLQRLCRIDGVSYCTEPSGAVSLRCKGVEFARLEEGRLLYGIETKAEGNASHTQEVEQLAAHLSSMPAGGQAAHPIGAGHAERWLEASVRSSIGSIDVALEGSPIHGQVLTAWGENRDVIDLLSLSAGGRLAVLELKAEEDLRLPLQALDYWISIKGHAEAQELQPFFAGRPMTSTPPKLYLVAPALSFHSSNSTILGYFAPEIDVERVGISANWQREFKVVTRLRGAESPMSHERKQ